MKKIFLILFVIALAVFAVAYWQWNKPRETASDKKADVVISIDSLYAAFLANDSLAFSTYQNKVIQISGILNRVEDQGEGNNRSNFAILQAQTEGIEAKFSFPDTLSKELLQKSVSHSVVLKGFFAGFNYDAMMPEMGGTFEFNQSAIIQNNSHELNFPSRSFCHSRFFGICSKVHDQNGKNLFLFQNKSRRYFSREYFHFFHHRCLYWRYEIRRIDEVIQVS